MPWRDPAGKPKRQLALVKTGADYVHGLPGDFAAELLGMAGRGRSVCLCSAWVLLGLVPKRGPCVWPGDMRPNRHAEGI